MAYISSRIPWNFRMVIFVILAISWCSGIAFFVLNNWVSVEGDFGPEKHPLQFPTLMIHAAAAFILMLMIGGILASHVPMSWKTKRLRKDGISLIALFGIQVITAYLLYYVANEDIRVVVSYLHLACGASFPFFLIAHIILGIKSRRSKPKNVI